MSQLLLNIAMIDIRERFQEKLEEKFPMTTMKNGDVLSPTTDLGLEGESVPLHSHIAYFWETEKEFADAVRFLEAGLRHMDHCVIFGHEEANEAVCKILRERGFDIEALQTERRLTVLGGNSSGDMILSTIAAIFEQALAGGAPLIRLFGNIGWWKDNWPDEHDLLAFEAKVTEATKGFPCIVVCMYDVRRLSGLIVHHGGFETHPFIVCEGSVRKNPYHVPTDIFLGNLEAIAAGISERKRADQVLRSITEGTASVTGNDFFRSLVRHLAQALQVRYAFVAECTDETKTRVRTLAFWTGEGFAEEMSFSLRGTPCENVIAGEVSCYPEGLQSLFPDDKELVALKAESYKGVPLYSSAGDILGHLVVMDDRPMKAVHHEVPILRIFAARAGVELERKRAEEALRKSEEQRRLLLEINNAIITKLTRDELFHAICEALGRVIPFDRVAHSLYDPEVDVLRIVTYAGPYRRADYSPIGRELDLSDSPAGWAFLHQKPLLRRDLETERQSSSEERAFGHGFRSLCALPLIVRGKSIGAVTVGSLTRFQYAEADAEFLMEVANQIAIAIDNMKSYDGLRRLTGELGALLDVNRAIGRHLERDALFGAMAGCLQGLLQTDRFGIELPLGDKLQGHLLTPRGGLSQSTEPHVLPAAGTACNWVLQNRQWIVTSSRDELRERFPATFQVMSREGMESLCAMPLLTGASCRGVLFCMAAGEGAYRDLPQALLEKVAVAVAVALDDCLAHEEVRRLRDRLEAENVYLQEEIKTEYNFEEIIGQSAPLKQLLRKLEQVAPTETTVLIQGETGTGKELLARAIHNLSPRKEHPLVKVNCGAIPAGLVESELFGHEKGAFTGATQRRIGRFELANGGTIFLDEVTELPPETQVKLLRVLQEGEFERLGSSQSLKVDVRVIAATNRDLKQVIKNGSLRSDLFYRLSVFPVEVPPLRERQSDIPLLVNFFLSRYAKKLGKEIQGVSKDTMDRLTKYGWPGNIRELQNVIERAVVVAEGAIVRIDELMLRIDGSSQASDLVTLEDMERAHIVRALMETKWVIHGTQGAASILGINPSTLRSRIQKLGIRRPDRST
jgi:formate hydrogenlyase transcriptional activator